MSGVPALFPFLTFLTLSPPWIRIVYFLKVSHALLRSHHTPRF